MTSPTSALTCPVCGAVTHETMPTDCCIAFFTCSACEATVAPKAGDCCVFCSYGDTPCPSRGARAPFPSAPRATGPGRDASAELRWADGRTTWLRVEAADAWPRTLSVPGLDSGAPGPPTPRDFILRASENAHVAVYTEQR